LLLGFQHRQQPGFFLLGPLFPFLGFTWGRSSSRVTSRHFDHGNGTLAFTSKLFRFG